MYNPNTIAKVHNRNGDIVGQDMLRDVPPYREHADEEVVRGVSEDGIANEATHEVNQNADLFDDIFGSAPASPVLGGQDGDVEVDLARPHAVEHSDIPRLRSTHVTNGYREGIAESKERCIQEGFDEGYSLGAELGMKAGWCLGVLEGICRALKGKHKAEELDTAMAKYERAQEELKMDKLFGKEYFGPDGIWLYNVPGAEDETTFRQVASAHPVLHVWVGEVHADAKRYDLTI